MIEQIPLNITHLLFIFNSRTADGVRSYQDKDNNDLVIPPFKPEDVPGLQLPEVRTKKDTMKYLTAGMLLFGNSFLLKYAGVGLGKDSQRSHIRWLENK